MDFLKAPVGTWNNKIYRASIDADVHLFNYRTDFDNNSAWVRVIATPNVDTGSIKHKAAWSALAHLGGVDISLWLSMYPSGLQPYRNSHFNLEEWYDAGYSKKVADSYLGDLLNSYNHPNAAIEPRIPGIFEYYATSEPILTKIYSRELGIQQGANMIAEEWEEITDKHGRENQIKLYKKSLRIG